MLRTAMPHTDTTALTREAAELEKAARPLTVGWDASLAAHVLYLALNLKCVAETRTNTRLSEAAKGLVRFLHERIHQPVPGEIHFADELRMRLSLITQYAEGEHTATPTKVNAQGRVFALAAASLTAATQAQHLGHFGFEVVSFSAVAALAEAADQQRPDKLLVLFDDEDSTSKANTLRALGELRRSVLAGVPLVVQSSETSFESRLAAVRAGAGAFLPWPCPINDVLNALSPVVDIADPSPLRVMLVEDADSLASFYASILAEQGVDTVVVNHPNTVLDSIITFRPDLILLDMYLKDCSGLEMVNIIRQQRYLEGISIVLMATEQQRQRHQDAYALGVDGLLVKPLAADMLVTTITARARRHRRLFSHLASDSLTGTLSHSYFFAQLDVELARAARSHVPLTLARINLDHFKEVNDVYGHPTGDQVLRALARMLTERLRHSDVVGRFGGDEFAIILPDTPADVAAEVIDALREAFAKVTHCANHASFHLTFSAGIATSHDGIEVPALVAAVGAALDAAKAVGGGCVREEGVVAKPAPLSVG